MTNRRWILNSLEVPTKNGIYDVRLTRKFDLLGAPIETIMEFEDGKWLMKVPSFINEYVVSAWRHR